MTKSNKNAVESHETQSVVGNFHLLAIGLDVYEHFDKTLHTAVRGMQEFCELMEEKYCFKSTNIIQLEAKAAKSNAIHGRLQGYTKEFQDGKNNKTPLIGSDDYLLIFLSGHGEYDKNATDKTFFIPYDGDPKTPSNWIQNDYILGYIRHIEAKKILLISDSCFSGALLEGTKRTGSSTQLSELEVLLSKSSRQVMTSCGMSESPDYGYPGHSAFTGVLLEALKQNDNEFLTAQNLFGLVKGKIDKLRQKDPNIEIPLFGHMRGLVHDHDEFVFLTREAISNQQKEIKNIKRRSKPRKSYQGVDFYQSKINTNDYGAVPFENREKFYFTYVLNGKAILRSYGHKNQVQRDKNLDTVVKNCENRDKYRIELNANLKKYYFTLLANNNHVIAKSIWFESEEAAEEGIDYLIKGQKETHIFGPMVQQLRSRVQELESERLNILSNKKGGEKKAKKLQTENKQLQTEKKQLQIKIEKAGLKLETIQTQKTEAEKQVSSYLRMFNETSSEKLALTSKLENVEAQIPILEEKLKITESEVQRATEEKGELEEKINLISDALNSANGVINSRDDHITDLKEQLVKPKKYRKLKFLSMLIASFIAGSAGLYLLQKFVKAPQSMESIQIDVGEIWNTTKTQGLVSEYKKFVKSYPGSVFNKQAIEKLNLHEKATLQLQRSLEQKGFLSASADGIADNLLRAAIVDFQLKSDGKFNVPNLKNVNDKPILLYAKQISEWSFPTERVSIKRPTKVVDKLIAGKDGVDILNTLLILPDNSILLAGETETCVESNLINVECDTNGWLLKIDENGEELWPGHQNFGGKYGKDEFNAILPLPDGGFLLVGTTTTCHPNLTLDHNCEYATRSSRKDKNGWVVHVDQNGDQKWSKSYGGSKDDVFRTAILSSTNTVIIGGHSQSCFSQEIDCSNRKTQGWLINIDLDGNVIFNKNHGEASSSESIKSIYQTSEGQLLTTGYSRNESSGSNRGWFLTADHNGEFLNAELTSYNAVDFDQLTVLPNGNTLFAGYNAGSYYSGTIQAHLAGKFKDAVITNLTTLSDYTKSDYNSMVSFVENGPGSDQFVLAAGYLENSTDSTQGLISKFDQNGKEIWSHDYGEKGRDSFNALGILPDGSIVLVGKSCSSKSLECDDLDGGRKPKFDGWFVKLQGQLHAE